MKVNKFYKILFALSGHGDAADRVVLLEVDEADALGGPAGRADLLGLDPDGLPGNRDDEEVDFADAQDGHGLPDLGRDLEVDQALPAAALDAVGRGFGPLSVALLAGGEDVLVLVADGHHADDLVLFGQGHRPHAGRGPAHRPDVLFLEPDGLAQAGGENDVPLAVGQAGPHELALGPQVHGDDPAAPDIFEFGELRFLDLAVGGHHDHERVLVELLDGHDRGRPLVRLELEEVGDGLAPPGHAHVGDLEGLEPVHPADVGEDRAGRNGSSRRRRCRRRPRPSC